MFDYSGLGMPSNEFSNPYGNLPMYATPVNTGGITEQDLPFISTDWQPNVGNMMVDPNMPNIIPGFPQSQSGLTFPNIPGGWPTMQDWLASQQGAAPTPPTQAPTTPTTTGMVPGFGLGYGGGGMPAMTPDVAAALASQPYAPPMAPMAEAETPPPQDVQQQIWQPVKPTDWASKQQELYAKTVGAYKDEPFAERGPTVTEMLQLFAQGAGLGINPYQNWKSQLSRERRGHELGKAQQLEAASRDYNVGAKTLELQKATEDKAVSDKLRVIETLVNINPTLIDRFLPEIAAYHGMDPKDVEKLKDPKTGKFNIYRDPVDLEIQRSQRLMKFREQIAPTLGFNTQTEANRFIATGDIEKVDVPTYIGRKIQDAMAKGDTKTASSLQNYLGAYQYAISGHKQQQAEERAYKVQGAREFLQHLSPELQTKLAPYIMGSTVGIHIPVGAVEAAGEGGAGGKSKFAVMKQKYDEAQKALADPTGEAYNKFTDDNGVDPAAFSHAFAQQQFGIKLPNNASSLGLQSMGVSPKERQNYVDRVQLEEAARRKDPKIETPTINMINQTALEQVRSIYGQSYIRTVNTELRKLRQPELSDLETLQMYNYLQQFGFVPANKYAVGLAKTQRLGASQKR